MRQRNKLQGVSRTHHGPVDMMRNTGAPVTRMAANENQEPSLSEKISLALKADYAPGDPDDLPPCPSGVSAFPKPMQAAVCGGVFLGIGAGTIAVLSGLAALPTGWNAGLEFSSPLSLGVIFMAAGISHFTLHEDFCRIYPGKGAWGFWYLPGSASFHVNWTGVAELLGGLGLALGGLGLGPQGLMPAAALSLFALVIAVTPANVYMFTHGAQLPAGLEVPVLGHAIRGAFQCLLLGVLWSLAS
ncbi:unnamed protein product [Discosporangium mesarthrocarpum]